MRYFSQRSFDIGQKLIKNMGLYCAARYLRNLGIPLESAIEYLAVRKSA